MTENKGGRGEAGILPTELLPLSQHLKYSKNNRLHARPKSKSLRIRDSTAGSTVIHSKRRRAKNPCSLVGEKDTTAPHDFPASKAARFRLSASGVVREMNGAQGAHILVLGLKVHAPVAHSANCPPVSLHLLPRPSPATSSLGSWTMFCFQ